MSDAFLVGILIVAVIAFLRFRRAKKK